MPRFVLHQGAKWRAIDDGRASRANSGAGFTAQVHTATVDGVVANVRTFYRRVLQRFGTKLPDDFAMEGGVDDETAAFGYRPTRDDDAPFLIVAVFNPVLRRVQFGEMNGHPFGVGAAVLNYNRQLEVVIHTMRTVLGVCAHHFYDDAVVLGLNVEKGSVQQSYHALQDLLHTKLDKSKRQLMSQIFVYSGVLISFAELFQYGGIALAPKPSRVEAIRDDFAHYRRVDRLRLSWVPRLPPGGSGHTWVRLGFTAAGVQKGRDPINYSSSESAQEVHPMPPANLQTSAPLH